MFGIFKTLFKFFCIYIKIRWYALRAVHAGWRNVRNWRWSIAHTMEVWRSAIRFHTLNENRDKNGKAKSKN